MFRQLGKKWKVSGWRLLLILCTFALGGSLCGYAGRQVLQLLAIDQAWLRIILYIILVTLLWPVCVLAVSLPLGQFTFFRNYLQRMGKRFMTQATSVQQLAVFASGAGSNAAKIIEHFKGHPSIRVSLIVCNKPGAGVLQIAENNGIPVLVIEKEPFFRGNAYLPALQSAHIDFIVLAGFLWKIPAALIEAYPNKIINIHPALLPKFGGKGMYGSFVHEAVISQKETESGITIHYVDGHYDNGDVIFQATCPVTPEDTPATLAAKVHHLEHKYFPAIIEDVVKKAQS